jgi:glycosyltransferase involved in cell wall biosynthesis
MNSKLFISIIVPVFNEQDNVENLYDRLIGVVGKLSDQYDFEFIFTDNHSTDDTFTILKKIAENDLRVKVLRFTKNFGVQASILTGYQNASGDAAIQIDCDLQDPPELIAEFLNKWRQGYQDVYGIRRSRQEGTVINWIRSMFYKIIDILADDPLPHDVGDFRLIDRKVIDLLKNVDERNPYLRGMIAAFGFEQFGIPYERDLRKHGESKFSLYGLLSLAMDGILSHSIVPLRFASISGLIMAMITICGILFYMVNRIWLDDDSPAGFATTTILILFSITLNALFLGIIGEYLGRMYQQLKPRPLTIIEHRVNSNGD